MLIDFETKIRWRIIISSSHQSVSEQSARPGACPRGSSSETHSYCSSTIPPPRRYSNDTFEDTHSLRNGEQNQGRRNSFWNFRKLFKEIRQMYSHCRPRIDPGEPQPPDARLYETLYVGGFSDGTILELPVTPLTEAAELENPQQNGSSLPYDTGEMRGGYPNREHLMSLEPTVSRKPERTDMTRFSLGLNSQQTFDPVPSLLSGHQSHISSPVSSLDTNIVYDLHFGSRGEFRKNSESSINIHSTFQQDSIGINGIDIEQNGTWSNDFVPLATMSRTEASFVSAGESPFSYPAFRHDRHVDRTSWPHSNGVPASDAGSTASPSMQSSTATAPPQSHDAKSIPLGVWQPDSKNVWRHRPSDTLERHNAVRSKTANRSTIGVSPLQSLSQAGQFHGQQQLKTYVEHHDYTYPEVIEKTRCTCSQCGMVFHGRYCNTNMRRHARVVHEGIAGRACGICGLCFRRSDAARKHEWDKHKLSSAEPKKRASS